MIALDLHNKLKTKNHLSEWVFSICVQSSDFLIGPSFPLILTRGNESRIARRKGRTTTVYMLIQMHITCNSHKKLYKKYCHLYFTNEKQSQDIVDGFFFKNTKQENNKPTFLGKCQSHWTRRMAFQILLYDSSTSSPPTSRNRLIFKSST